MKDDVTVSALSGAIGACIDGIDLAQPLSDENHTIIFDALMKHLVVFFRGQDLTDDQQLAFASRFGKLNVYPIHESRGLYQPLDFIEDTPESPPRTDLWHTDATFLAEPPDIAVLNMRKMPPVGGDTMWLNLYLAYEKLSDTMKQVVDTLKWEVHVGDSFKQTTTDLYGEDVYNKVADIYRGGQQPMVRVHPVTGRKALFMCGDYVKGVAGMHPAESRLLLDYLRSLLHDPNIQVRWRYQPYDVAMWDERCTNHRGLSDHWPAHRIVRRCTVGASRAKGPFD